jgi:hypothetical protein
VVVQTRVALLVLLLGASAMAETVGGRSPAEDGSVSKVDVARTLSDLGVELGQQERPSLRAHRISEVRVSLQPQVSVSGRQVVSFGLPFPPHELGDDNFLRVEDSGGIELAAYTDPLAHWWIDGERGSLRSVLVQFEATFTNDDPVEIVIRWDRRRDHSRDNKVPISDLQVDVQDDGFVYHQPKVLALLPPEWLCTSLVAWQQVPASRNKVASWFDQHLLDQFPGSLQHISSEKYAPHLYDRPGTYAKIYIRHGKAEHLQAALRSADFYVQHLGDDGFFTMKPRDHKYVYAEGTALLYLLKGDDRYRDAVILGLTSWEKWAPIKYGGEGFWTERHAAFAMAAYIHTYELTGDIALIDAAVVLFDGVFRLQVNPLDGGPPDGAWLHTAESHGDGNGWTTSPWMSALLMDSIWKLWMLTGDERCPASLAMYAKFIDRHAVTVDRKRLYYMANSPGRGESLNPEYPPHHLEACYILAMGYYLSGGSDASLLDTLQGLWPPLMDDNANTPPRKFSWRFRETSMLVWFLNEMDKE